MTKTVTTLLVASLLGAGTPLFAQHGRQHPPRSAASEGGDPARAGGRGEGSRGRERTERAEPARTDRAEPAPAAEARTEDAQDRSRGRGPREDDPRAGSGRAIPREGPPPRELRDGREGDRRVYVVPPRGIYNNRPNAYPRRYYPYGYSAFGLGFHYYDPYGWYPSGRYGYGYYPGRPSVYVDGRYRYDVGSLRLDVMGPTDAQVFVDGYYAGIVDDFDGAFQSLDLESGAYHIEIVAPGFEPLAFDVRMQPGRKINYRGELRRLP